MKTAVIYATLTGHSKKIAKAVADELGIKSLDIKIAPVIKDIDILIIIGGIYRGKSLNNMVAYINTLDDNAAKKAILITTCGSKDVNQIQIREILNNKNINVMQEEYICKGSFLFFGLGHPNKKEIQKAVEFVKNSTIAIN